MTTLTIPLRRYPPHLRRSRWSVIEYADRKPAVVLEAMPRRREPSAVRVLCWAVVVLALVKLLVR